jgi:hypothetical protein
MSLKIARYYISSAESQFDETASTISLMNYRNALNILTDDTELVLVAELHTKATEKSISGFGKTTIQYLKTAKELLNRLSVSTDHTSNLLFKVQTTLFDALVQNCQLDDSEKVLDETSKQLNSSTRRSHWTVMHFIQRIAKNDIEEAFKIFKAGSNCAIGNLLIDHNWCTFDGLSAIKKIEEQLSYRNIDSILALAPDPNETLSLLEKMLSTCIELCEARNDLKGAAFFTLLGCSFALKEGFTGQSIMYFAAVQPFFLGRTFEYFNYKRAQFIGQLVQGAISKFSIEKKALAHIELLQGNSYFWTFQQAEEKTINIAKLAIEKNRPHFCILTLIEFVSRYILPCGKSLAYIRDLDQRIGGFCVQQELNSYEWNLVFGQIEAIFEERSIKNINIMEIPRKFHQFTRYVTALQSIIFGEADRKEKLISFITEVGSLHGSWM